MIRPTQSNTAIIIKQTMADSKSSSLSLITNGINQDGHDNSLQLCQSVFNEVESANNFTYKTMGHFQYQTIAQWYAHCHSLPVSAIAPDSIKLVSEFHSFYSALILGSTSQNDTILVFAPALHQHCSPVRALNRSLSVIELVPSQNGGFTLPSLSDVLKNKNKPKLIVISNPTNPLGSVLLQQAITELLSACPQIPVLFDQRLGDCTLEGFKSSLHYNHLHPNLITFNEVGSFMHRLPPTHSLFNCGKGFAVLSNKAERERVETVMYQGLKILPNQLHRVLFKVCYASEQGMSYWQNMRRRVKRNYRLIEEYFVGQGMAGKVRMLKLESSVVSLDMSRLDSLGLVELMRMAENGLAGWLGNYVLSSDRFVKTICIDLSQDEAKIQKWLDEQLGTAVSKTQPKL